MRTTGYQISVLDRLEAGGVIEVRAPVPPKRTARFWIGGDPINTGAVRRLFERGWISATKKPGGGDFTGRAVITNLGRAALQRSR